MDHFYCNLVRPTFDDLSVIKITSDEIRMQAGLRDPRQRKQQVGERRKEACGPENRKRNKGGKNGVTCGGCVIFLIASTETGNGAVTHRKWADGKDKLQKSSGSHRSMPKQLRKDKNERILFFDFPKTSKQSKITPNMQHSFRYECHWCCWWRTVQSVCLKPQRGWEISSSVHDHGPTYERVLWFKTYVYMLDLLSLWGVS